MPKSQNKQFYETVNKEIKETSAQKLPLGTEMILRDGRRYRWSRRYLHAGPGKPGITF